MTKPKTDDGKFDIGFTLVMAGAVVLAVVAGMNLGSLLFVRAWL